MARASRRQFGHLPGCTTIPEFSSTNCPVIRKRSSVPRFKKKRCKSELGPKTSSTGGGAARAVPEMRDRACSVPGPMEKALAGSC